MTWTAVMVPFECSNISIRNTDPAASIRIRTDPNTEDSLGPLAQQAMAVPFHRYRSQAGATPFYLRSTAGVGPACVMFLYHETGLRHRYQLRHGQANITPSFNLVSGTMVHHGGGLGTVARTASANALCVNNSAAATANVFVAYT